MFLPDGLTNRSMCRDISIREDLVIEAIETFSVILATGDGAVEVTGGNSTVNIQDATGNVRC